MDHETQREFEVMRKHFTTVIRFNEERRSERDLTAGLALDAALKSNDKRLEGMNAFRAALTDQANGMVTRKEWESSRTTLVDKLEQSRLTMEARCASDLDNITTKVDEFGRPNWPLMVSALSAFLVVIAGVWLVIGLKIETTIAPLSASFQELKVSRAAATERLSGVISDAASSATADATSRTDRAQLNERLQRVEAIVTKDSGTIVGLTQKLVEVETQFCGSDIVRNLMHANDLRTISILWSKVFVDAVYPTNNVFYPQICNRPITPPN